MTVLELNELVKVLEKKFGVSAQAVAVAGLRQRQPMRRASSTSNSPR